MEEYCSLYSGITGSFLSALYPFNIVHTFERILIFDVQSHEHYSAQSSAPYREME